VPAPATGVAPHRLAVAVRAGQALGFRLAGLDVREVAPGDEASAWKALVADARLGVLAIEEELLAAMPEGLVARARSRGLPVLLPFPLPRRLGAPGRGQAWVAALLRRAVGYGVALGAASAARPPAGASGGAPPRRAP
jgi:V/A-type H+-transporting ATPase subunit F